MKKNAKREGFTLVELLIVIVVIGVLSAMMMLSSTEAVSSAKAADIVSDLRNLKTAALAYYADHLASADALPETILSQTGVRDAILKYMNNDNNIDKAYQFTHGTENGHKNEWYVYYNNAVTDGGKQITDTVAKKLTARAKSVGLLKSAKVGDIYNSSTAANVYMFIR